MTSKIASWSQVKLRNVLTYTDQLVDLDDEAEYTTITVKRRHGGLEAREKLFGSQIRTKKQFKLIPGSFIISRVQCWHQAYAIVPETIKPNMIASTNYDQFIISPEVDKRFFWWLSYSPIFTEIVRSCAFGVVIEKMVFNRNAWLDKTISIPPLSEQQRIVVRIEELAAKIEEARGLRREAMKEAEAITNSVLRQIFSSNNKYQIVPFESVCDSIIDNLHSNPIYADQGIPCVRSPDVGWGKLYLDTALKTSKEEYIRRTVRGEPRPDDIVLVREGGGTGKAAIVDEGQHFSLGQRVMMLRPDKQVVIPKFLLYQLLSPIIYEDQILLLSKGSAAPHLNISTLRSFTFILPSLPEQHCIVTYLDNLQSKVDSLMDLQTETSAELDALLPSIFDKAFKGEL